VDRHQPTTQSAHDSTGRDPRDDCGVLQPLRRWDVCTGRDRWRREGQCLDGSSFERVRVSTCSSREPHGICNLRIGPVVANECDPFIEASRAASRAGTVIRLPIILRIRDQCSSTTAKSTGAPLAGVRISNRTRQGSRTEGTTARSRMMHVCWNLTSLLGENATTPNRGAICPAVCMRLLVLLAEQCGTRWPPYAPFCSDYVVEVLVPRPSPPLPAGTFPCPFGENGHGLTCTGPAGIYATQSGRRKS
jgi:hypothetical protein